MTLAIVVCCAGAGKPAFHGKRFSRFRVGLATARRKAEVKSAKEGKKTDEDDRADDDVKGSRTNRARKSTNSAGSNHKKEKKVRGAARPGPGPWA